MNFDFATSTRKNMFGTGVNQKQIDSINAIMTEINKQGVTDVNAAAYILATAYHECYNPRTPGTRLTPMEEFGGDAYLRSKKYYPFYGRGFSQITWRANYDKEGKRMGIDLITAPELMLNVQTAANSHVYCMLHGVYTGKKLSDYFGSGKCDFVNARRIINGLDEADRIAGYATQFVDCLK